MENQVKRAEILIDALPYIKEFRGSTFVIKYGGNAMIDQVLKENVILDFLLLHYVGIKVVVVHGGGPAISSAMNKMNIKPQFIDGHRVTDLETLGVAEMVLTGQVNKEIVSLINRNGGKAVGLSGKDGKLIQAVKKPVKDQKDLGFVGEVKSIDPDIIRVLESNGFMTVISPIGIDENGQSFNINADNVAAHIAASLNAEKLFLLTDVHGIMTDLNDPESLVAQITLDEIEQAKRDGIISGGMIPKVDACVTAISNGVKNAHIINGTLLHALLLETFTTRGIGTKIFS